MLSSSLSRRYIQTTRRRLSIFNINVKNDIIEKRLKYYSSPVTGAENPTYLKEPGDQIYFAVGMGAAALGVGSVLVGLYHMTFGLNKKK